MADPLQHWLATPFGQAIQEHIKSGRKIFPLHGVGDDLNCTCGLKPCGKENKGAGKHPYAKTVPNGVLNATYDIEEAGRLFEYRTDLNVGVATGIDSRIFVIDVDNKNDERGTDSLERLEAVLGQLPDTMTLLTGNGFHIVFDYPEDEDLRNGTNTFGDEYPDIDTRGNGGYIVAYPSRHFTGRYYEKGSHSNTLADIPSNYLQIIKAGKRKEAKPEKEVDRSQSSGETPEWNEADIASALSFIDPDIGYTEWIFVGMGLHREGFSIDMWDNWSSRGSKYNGIGDLQTHWRSFNVGGSRTIGTVIEWAMIQGWQPQSHYEERVSDAKVESTVAPLVAKMQAKNKVPLLVVDAGVNIEIDNSLSAIDKPVQKKQDSIKKPSKKRRKKLKFDFDPMQLPGVLGDTVRWITKYAIYEQPDLAMLNAIAFAGAIFGRKYASPVNTRTNIYLVGIAETGFGKDHSRQMINALAMESGLSHYMGGNSIRSDTGMLRGLMNNASQILQLDEFGMFMQALSDPHAPHHVRSVTKALMSLYSDSKGVYHHGDYADAKAKPIKIACPNLCIYGTTTEASYVPALKKAAIESGELNRFIVVPSMCDLELKRHVPMTESEDSLVEWWKKFAPDSNSSMASNMNGHMAVPTPIMVEWGDCEELQFKIREEQTEICKGDNPLRGLWSRMYENTIKIAMIFAIARNPENPKFEEADFDYAYNIVRLSIQYMETLAENGMAETQREASHIEILNVIKESGIISRREILRRFRKYNKREMDEIVGAMLEEEVITAERVAPVGAGRPYTVYQFVNEETA